MALALVLILTSVVTGTLANAVESANGDQNLTQTSGENVKIEQATYARGTNFLSLFDAEATQNGQKPTNNCGELLPAVYSGDFDWNVCDNECECNDDCKSNETYTFWCKNEIQNAVDQIVKVKNVGTQAVYFRTVFAFEADTSNYSGTLIHKNRNTDDYNWSGPYKVTIEGVNYEILVATYKYVLGADAVAPPSLLQIALDKDADNADVAQFGDNYEIEIFSQAVTVDIVTEKNLDNLENIAQVALNTAFYEVSTTKHPWIPDSTATD